MVRVALIGANGFVGSALCKTIIKTPKVKLVKVTRDNYNFFKKQSFDMVINSAMPSARHKANLNPQKDFEETVVRTANILYCWKFKKFIQISTISARSELDNAYGRHKAAAENLCNFGDNLVIRLTAMFDETLKKGVLIDILNSRKIFVDENSRYSFSSLNFVSNWIAKHLREKGIIELGARNSLSLKKIASKLKLKIDFEGKRDIQEIYNPRPEYPDANEVLIFLKEKLRKSKID